MSTVCTASPSKLSRAQKYSAVKRRRTVPGPAGLLPDVSYDCRSRRSWPSVSGAHDLSSSVLDQPIEKCELDDLWRRIAENCGSEVWSIISIFNIEHICEIAPKEGFPRGKIPVLCAALDKIDALFSDAKAVLRDCTGFIGCTLDRCIIRKYKKYLSAGVILLVKQASLFSRNGKTFYLNITQQNLVRLYLDDDHSTIDQSNLSSAFCVVRSCQISNSLAPFSFEELKDLVAACLTPPPIPLDRRIVESSSKVSNEDESQIFSPKGQCSPSNQVNPTAFKSPNSPTFAAAAALLHFSGNTRLRTDTKSTFVSPLTPATTSCLPRRRDLRSLLESSSSQPESCPPPKINPLHTDTAIKSPSLTLIAHDVENALDDRSKALADFLEDDMEDLFASVLE